MMRPERTTMTKLMFKHFATFAIIASTFFIAATISDIDHMFIGMSRQWHFGFLLMFSAIPVIVITTTLIRSALASSTDGTVKTAIDEEP